MLFQGVFMKKMLLLPLIWGIGAACFAQTATLDMSLSTAKTYMEIQLPLGAQVLVADVAAPTKELGSYIAEEISTRLVNDKRLTVVERSAAVMQALSAETAYQLSGEVSDNSIQSIGQKTGAEYIITGAISGAGDQYRLRFKITAVKTSEVKGQWSAAIQSDTVLSALLTQKKPAVETPQWINMPLSARSKHEPDGQGVSLFYYDRGLSNKATTRQTAEARARQNIQQMIAANIASQICARIDMTEFSENMVSDIEEVQRRIETTVTQSIKTRVPSYETLEYYVETGKENGRDWYIVYILVRFARRDIVAMIERLETEKLVENILKEMNIRESAARERARQELLVEMKEIIADTGKDIREGVTGN
jgi:TolB-like protein